METIFPKTNVDHSVLRMQTYIILLRAVTPTGKNKVPMAQLRQVLQDAGFEAVRTYIQTGNIILNSNLPAGELEQRIHTLIAEHIGPDLVVVARTKEQLSQLLKANPFQRGYAPSRVFFSLLASQPSAEKIAELNQTDFGEEKLHLTNDTAYMYIPGPYGRGKVSSAMLEKKLGVAATMRNYNTLTKLDALTQ